MILAAFAALVGVLTSNQLRSQLENQVRGAADQLASELQPMRIERDGELNCDKQVSLSDYVSTEHAQIRIMDANTGFVYCTQDQVRVRGAKPTPVSPQFPPPGHAGTFREFGYLVGVPHRVPVKTSSPVWVLYAAPLSDLDHTLARVQFFLLLGVLGGTVLALLAGLATAARAIRPIVELTEAAREIERTRDPSRHVPVPKADDEVAELAHTLEGMLQSLDEARTSTETVLHRQREFVADASHELRTPLTSVLASLELLCEELDGEQAETAQGALRSARRMRRLVGDLLLLARADAKRVQPRMPTELADVLMEAASEIGPVSENHELAIDARPATVSGVRDDLHRMVLNLLENAVKHTPAGTRISACTWSSNGDVFLVVEDSGPGIPPELAPRVFERFIRGGGEGGKGSGLGLSIVRAVVESHDGTVKLAGAEDKAGTRFEITLPAASGPTQNGRSAPVYTSTTTGSTIGRRRRRS